MKKKKNPKSNDDEESLPSQLLNLFHQSRANNIHALCASELAELAEFNLSRHTKSTLNLLKSQGKIVRVGRGKKGTYFALQDHDPMLCAPFLLKSKVIYMDFGPENESEATATSLKDSKLAEMIVNVMLDLQSQGILAISAPTLFRKMERYPAIVDMWEGSIDQVIEALQCDSFVKVAKKEKKGAFLYSLKGCDRGAIAEYFGGSSFSGWTIIK